MGVAVFINIGKSDINAIFQGKTIDFGHMGKLSRRSIKKQKKCDADNQLCKWKNEFILMREAINDKNDKTKISFTFGGQYAEDAYNTLKNAQGVSSAKFYYQKFEGEKDVSVPKSTDVGVSLTDVKIIDVYKIKSEEYYVELNAASALTLNL